MDPKPSSARNLLVRVLLLGVFALVLRFVYVVTIHGGSCGGAGDFCLLSSPASAAGTAAFVRVAEGGGAATPALWTSREWRKTVEYYSAVFQDLVAEGFLSSSSKSLCVDTPAGHEVLALREIGVPNSLGVARKTCSPLVVGAGGLLRLPFPSNFDFVFADRSLDRSKRPADLASEIARVLKPDGFLVLHTASAGDAYSLQSLRALLPTFRFLRSREINGPESPSPLRQIIFQKNPNNPLANPNPANKCSIRYHNLQILQSLEPLIQEEPLKPWITLKRNINSIKYLPSMVDISFKNRYIYIDVGARSYGSSIGSWFKKQYPKQNRTFEIFAVEADPAFHAQYAHKHNVNLLPFAAWLRNETLTFEIDRGNQGGGGGGMGRIRPAAASSVRSGEVREILGFDFAEWLKAAAVAEKDYVVVKMDVEGSEFDLIPRLFETGAICLVDELFLECHYNRWQKCCPGERSPKYNNTYRECLDLFTSLRERGVLVHQWW
ncbi:uncharacterized protein [Typha latifolia]|uniref:uncharacterized protein n=1 Tax=Typha latifolia TaxID=4733 RepID=UPI003C3042AB